MERMKKEDRRLQILEAAIKVFINKGYKGSTTLEIAKAANISEVTLFRFFTSKKEIFLEGVEPILFSTLEGTFDISNDLSPALKLEHVLYERISLISKNYEIVKLILNESSLLQELGSESFMNRILDIIKNMLIQIGLSTIDNEYALRVIMGSILSFLYLPETDINDTKNYVRKVVAGILIDDNNTNKEDINEQAI